MNHISRQNVTIPPGTPVHSMGGTGWTPSKRTQTVKDAEVAQYGEWTVTTWPGAGGYWRRTVQRDGEYVGHWPVHEEMYQR